MELQPTSWADNKELIFSVWSAYNQDHGYTMMNGYTMMREQFCMFEYAPGFGFTPEQIRAAIECWGAILVREVNAATAAAAERYAASNPF